jgi:hypothetical protein
MAMAERVAAGGGGFAGGLSRCGGGACARCGMRWDRWAKRTTATDPIVLRAAGVASRHGRRKEGVRVLAPWPRLRRVSAPLSSSAFSRGRWRFPETCTGAQQGLDDLACLALA